MGLGFSLQNLLLGTQSCPKIRGHIYYIYLQLCASPYHVLIIFLSCDTNANNISTKNTLAVKKERPRTKKGLGEKEVKSRWAAKACVVYRHAYIMLE